MGKKPKTSHLIVKSKNSQNKQKLRVNVFSLVFGFFLIGYLSFNIFFSQTISPLYFGVINENKPMVGDFLAKIKSSPFFSPLLTIYKKIYGPDIEPLVFSQERKIKEEIFRLEEILTKNPKARDILIRLSQLYDKLGNKIKAEEYSRKATEIDPNIN